MNIDPKTLSFIKTMMLTALCIYIALSASLYVYLQIRFFDPLHFRKVSLRILAVTAIFLFDLILSVRQTRLRKTNRSPSRLSYILTSFCAVWGFAVFFRFAFQTGKASAWFLSCYILVILLLSAYELITFKP